MQSTYLSEDQEFIMLNNKKMMKPFVEKPINSEDHNIYIYYPVSIKGGHTRLFRKSENTSSKYYPDQNEVSRHSSFIY